jgi:beta-glucosidase
VPPRVEVPRWIGLAIRRRLMDRRPNGRSTRPIRALAAFRRVPLNVGETQRITFRLRPAAFATVTEDGNRIVDAGTFTIAVGGQQPDASNHYASAAKGVTGQIHVMGAQVEVP